MMSYSPFVGLGLHVFFNIILLFGFISGLIWLARFAKKETVIKVVLWASVIGIVGSLVTIPWSMQGAGRMMRWAENESRLNVDRDDDRENPMQEMMEEVWNRDASDEEPAAQ